MPGRSSSHVAILRRRVGDDSSRNAAQDPWTRVACMARASASGFEGRVPPLLFYRVASGTPSSPDDSVIPAPAAAESMIDRMGVGLPRGLAITAVALLIASFPPVSTAGAAVVSG